MMVSIRTQIAQISALLGTKAVNTWETEFIESILTKTKNGDNTTSLSEKQVECIEKIYNKNYS